MPPVAIANLWENKQRALENLEKSFREDRPRALIQMATGSGKTMLAVTSIYRLIKFGGARRVLFLVDRSNLGNQAEKEFEGYRTPDDHRKFTDLYKVQHLKGNTIGSSTKVVITTIQRLYSMLRGEPEFDPAGEEQSQFIKDLAALREPLPVAYDKAIPPEFFDIVFHRRMPSQHLYIVAASARILRRISDWPHCHAIETDAWLLRTESRDGISP
jgi:type I restriction enzyme R subunit